MLFFEKQRASLSESTINDMKKQISETNLMISKSNDELKGLNDELAYKD